MKALGLAAIAALSLGACAAPSLPDYGRLPDFRLVAEDGSRFGSEQLKGAPWIADFIYTSCPGPCSALSARFARLQAALPGAVRLVSVTVDPEKDRPQVLRAYAARFGADPRRWRFLTGARADIDAVARRGFKLATALGAGGSVAHSVKIALVDRTLRVRGYYDGDDSAAIKRLERDASALATDGGSL